MSIHERIKNRRIAMGFESHRALADVLKLSWQTVQQWEKEGGTAPKRNRLDEVAKVLGVSAEWLRSGVGSPISIHDKYRDDDGSNSDIPSLGTVGDRLDKAMSNAGFKSQSALSKMSGVPQPTIARILKNQGKGAPEAATLKKLASACGVTFNWLNEGIDDGNKQTLNARQREWLALLNNLGVDDVDEFSELIRQRQSRNMRLLKEFKNKKD